MNRRWGSGGLHVGQRVRRGGAEKRAGRGHLAVDIAAQVVGHRGVLLGQRTLPLRTIVNHTHSNTHSNTHSTANHSTAPRFTAQGDRASSAAETPHRRATPTAGEYEGGGGAGGRTRAVCSAPYSPAPPPTVAPPCDGGGGGEGLRSGAPPAARREGEGEGEGEDGWSALW
jgi:hypothetical protein